MNSFVKKFLGGGAMLQLAVLALSAQTAMDLGRLPLWFEADHDATQFVAHGRDSEILLSPAGAEFVFRQSARQTVSARMEFVGVNSAAQISGGAEMAGKVNYLLGRDATHWQSGVATYGRVQASQIYPGVNVVYYGNQQRLEYDFDLAPGVKPETIALRFTGADKVSVNPRGELVITLAGREIIQHQPVAYQMSGDTRQEIQVGYKMLDAHTVAFSVGKFDAQLPLVIDPVLSYATFFGGNSTDIAWAVALGNDHSIYIAGQTLSTKISSSQSLATPGALQTAFQGGGKVGDAFIAKFHDPGTNAAELADLSTNLIYCTYLGGKGEDAAYALAVDDAGHVYVAGGTQSTNFPVRNAAPNFSKISGTLDKTVGVFPTDAFVAELETNGASLIYSMYLGGSGYDAALGLALDENGNAFVTGYTASTNFPVTPGAWQTNAAFLNTLYVNANAFIAEISTGEDQQAYPAYSTYLGGTNYDSGRAVTYNNHNLTVVGSTTSTNFPTTNFINQPWVQSPFFTTNKVVSNHVTTTNITTNYFNGSRLNGSTNKVSQSLAQSDAFVASFTVDGTSLTPRYITLLGGTNDDIAYGVAMDAAGNAYVVGGSDSRNFVNTTNGVLIPSYIRTNTTGVIVTNAFLTQVTWSGTNARVGYSQQFGGNVGDVAQGVALDAAGNIFIIGSSGSLNFPTTTNSLIGSLTVTNTGKKSGVNDVFVTAVKADFSALLYSAYFGGTGNDYGHAIAVDADGNAFIVGQTLSTKTFPVFNAWQPVAPDANNGFLAKIWLNSPVLPTLSINHSGMNLLVSWPPVAFAEFTTNDLRLATATNLLVKSTNWTVVTTAPVFTNGGYTYKFGPTNQTRFFRLQKK